MSRASADRQWRRAVGVVLWAVVAACASTGPGEKATTEPFIWDVRGARSVTENELVAALGAARYRLLGEIHDNPSHHAIRARLIAELAARGARPAVVFEQFDLDRDAALQAAQSSGADVEALADAGGLDRRAWMWPMHKPLIEAALAAHLPVRAGNLARSQLRGDRARAVEEDTHATGYRRFHAAAWTEAQAAALTAEIAEGHCGEVPEAIVPRLVLAQRLRDAAMAEALVDAATSDGAILIAGDGHVRADLGVPVYLHARGMADADSPSISVAFVEASDASVRPADFPKAIVDRNPGFDYLWVTPPAPRDDPCAGMGDEPSTIR